MTVKTKTSSPDAKRGQNAKTQIVVVGAGVAGCCAAIQAARLGVHVVLIERSGVCGGTLSLSGIANPGLFFDENGRQIIGGIGWELVKECVEICGDTMPDFNAYTPDTFWHFEIPIDPVVFTALCDAKMQECGVEIHYHTMLAGIIRHNHRLKVTICEKNGLREMPAACVIDCTGDANAVHLAGGAVNIPSSCQPGTYSVTCYGIDWERVDMEQIRAAFPAAHAAGEILAEDLGFGTEFSDLFIKRRGLNANHVSHINGGDSEGRTRLELAGRASLLRCYRFLKRFPGFEHLHFQYAGLECGVRESCTIKGLECVTATDYLTGRKWPEPIANAFYPLDLHDADKGIIVQKLPAGVLPSVPRGALIPTNCEGLLAAGRIVSSDHEANAGLRIQAVCMATGQAAGALAALSVHSALPPAAVQYSQLRQTLLAHHAILPPTAD